MFPAVILVNWTVSDTITVTEGEGVTVELLGEAFGLYASAITIGIVCAETVSTNVKSGKREILSSINMMLGTICAHCHPWPCLQPSLAETLTFHLEPSFTLQMWRPLKADPMAQL